MSLCSEVRSGDCIFPSPFMFIFSYLTFSNDRSSCHLLLFYTFVIYMSCFYYSCETIYVFFQELLQIVPIFLGCFAVGKLFFA